MKSKGVILALVILGLAWAKGAAAAPEADAQLDAQAFADLEAAVPAKEVSNLKKDELTPFLVGSWALRVWREAAPEPVLAGTMKCSAHPSEIDEVLLLCEGHASRGPTTERGPRVDFQNVYLFSRSGFYEVQPREGRNGKAFYDPRERFLDQMVPLAFDVVARQRFVFDRSGNHGRFRFSRLDRSLAESSPDYTLRGSLERIPGSQVASVRARDARATNSVDLWECSSATTKVRGKPVLVVDLVDDLVLTLPDGARWEVECGTEETRTPFRATLRTKRNVVIVTLEVADILPVDPFDEGAYLFDVSSLFALRGGRFHDRTEDLGEATLPEGHVGRLTSLDRSTDAKHESTSVHGFAVRLVGSAVAILHASETTHDGKRSTAEVKRVLSMFGTRAAPLRE